MKFSCKVLSLYLSQEILIFSCKMQFIEKDGTCQGLMQKWKVHIDCEKVAQINILTNKIVICSKIIIKESKQNYTLHFFSTFSLLYSDDFADLIKKNELCLAVVSVLLKIRIGYTQISVPKIGISMSKAAFINPLQGF